MYFLSLWDMLRVIKNQIKQTRFRYTNSATIDCHDCIGALVSKSRKSLSSFTFSRHLAHEDLQNLTTKESLTESNTEELLDFFLDAFLLMTWIYRTFKIASIVSYMLFTVIRKNRKKLHFNMMIQ